MKIEHQGNPIADIAAEKLERFYQGLSIKFVPSVNSVNIGYEPGHVNIEVDTNKPIIDAKVNRPIHEYNPGRVSGYMIQYPSIKIDIKY